MSVLTGQLTNRLREAIAHHEAGRLDRAEAIYRNVAAAAPRSAVVFDLWGRLAEQQGRMDDAARHFRRALQFDPRSVSCAVRLASVLIATSRAAEAEQILRKLTSLLPQNAEAWNALGFALKVLNRVPEALTCHERAVTLNPQFAEGWLHWGLTLTLAGRTSEALQKQEKALGLKPDLTASRYSRAQLLHKLYRTEEALADYEAVLKAEPGKLEARSYRLFALQSLERMTPEELFAEHVAYGERVGRGPDRVPGHDYSPEKRLRVGILSPDFRTHSCAYFIEPLLRELDRTSFQVYLYHDHFVEDEVSGRLKTYSDSWKNTLGMSPLVFERLVRDDGLDMLIDLTGHVGNTIRLPSLAKRLAPVQITYLGYPDTTGVPAMDFRFTDAVADPDGESDRFATEKLVRFAPVAWAYQPPEHAPDIAPPPCASGHPVTFGCYSSPTKFTDRLFSTWARLLAAVPQSRLVLKGGDFEQSPVREHMLRWIVRNGVPEDRVELLPRTPDNRSHLEQYARVDVALDTFPYTGTTTICEALWMGRPMVTLRGNRHAARVGTSLLTAVGRPQWIASSEDEYIAIAAKLAADPSALRAEVLGLRDLMLSSPLLDHAGQAARFGEALRQCWREKSTNGI